MNQQEQSPRHTSASAERMRRYRQRRRDRLRCYLVELREDEITALVHKGLVTPGYESDPSAVLAGLYRFLDETLGA